MACARFAEAEDTLEAAREARRVAWATAAEAGVRHEDLADACGVSKGTVKAEIAKVRGATWMNRR